MGTSKQDLSRWFDDGVKQGATHMIVVCDTFDYEDYPVYVKPGEQVREKEAKHNQEMQKVMEVYNLALPKEQQMRQRRCFNY